MTRPPRTWLWRGAIAWILAVTLRAATPEFDVVIYGGTSAGITAAIEAAKLGKTVALVEPGQHFGGMSIEGLGSTDIDNHANFKNSPAVGGLAREFYRRIAKAYGKPEPQWKFEPSVAEKVLADWLAEHRDRVTLLPGHRLVEPLTRAAVKSGVRLQALRFENGAEVRGRVFIDATYEGDLLVAAGVETVIGREANATYGETKNGIRAETTHAQFKVKVDPFRVPGDPASGVIHTIQDEPLGRPGEGDARVQAYCFRLCFTDVPENRLPFQKPGSYDPAHYEIYRRYVAAGGKLWRPGPNLPNRKTDMGSWHDLSANLYGMNHAYPGGDYATRERVLREHLEFTQGLCWFLANDPALPEDLRGAWSRWGTCKDEFADHGGWPRQFYVRDARRMVNDFVITEHHTRNANQTPVDDPVAMAFWPPDTHSVRRIVRDGAAYNEGFVFGGKDWAPFGISYRALVPRASECENVLTPTCPSSSHVAYGAIRIEWTFMALGQAVGAAAAQAIERNVSVQQVDVTELHEQLQERGQITRLGR